METSTTAIRFPGLGLSFDPPRAAFTVFGHEIMWYGIIIAVGFLLAVLYAMKRNKEFGYSQDDLLDILMIAAPLGIIGARLYYCFFYDAEYYLSHPVEILYIWNGGLAIYGGIICGLGAATVVSLVKKIKPLAVLDVASIGFPIGQAIGRWGNFFNREAFGAPTTLPWRMSLYQGGVWITAHPCFLYESLWNLLGVLLLHLASKKRKFDGQIFLMYLAWYGLGRGLIEGLRTDSLYLPGTNLRISQALAFITFLVAVVLLIWLGFFKEHDPENMQRRRYERQCAAQALAEAAKGTKTIKTGKPAANVPDASHGGFTVLHSEGGVEDEPMADLRDVAERENQEESDEVKS